MLTRISANPNWNIAYLSLLVLTIICLYGCGAPATPPPAQPTAAPAQPTAAAARPNRAPTAAAQPTAAPPVPGSSGESLFSAPSEVAPLDRKIIKNAQLAMTVQNTATAIFQITGISTDVGGYVVGSRTYGEGDHSGAQISIAVPVDRFEQALNMVRHIALAIDQDVTSSAEVTEQFVDLESRLRNLEATAARLRDFMNRATTITETLNVNTELTRVEQETEQIKGKLNALNARSSFSTISVDIKEIYPTPTPSNTPTVTPTPTTTPTLTPIPFHPEETLGAAVAVQTRLFQTLANALIWFVVVLVPFILIALFLGGVTRWIVKKTRTKTIP